MQNSITFNTKGRHSDNTAYQLIKSSGSLLLNHYSGSIYPSTLFNFSPQLIKTSNQGNDIGLKLDFASQQYILGDIINLNSAALFVDAIQGSILGYEANIGSNGINVVPKFGNVILGDFGAVGNQTILQIDDQSQLIKSSYQATDIGLKLDFANASYSLGDYNNTSGSTKLVIDDNARRITVSGSLNISGSTTIAKGRSLTVVSGSVTISTGSVTMPNRSAFRVYGSSVTGIPSPTTISGSATTVDYNQGNNYNNTNGVFTVPVAGLYNVYYNGRTNSGALQQVVIYKNRVAGVGGTSMLMWETTGSNSGHFGVSGILNLAVNDTLEAVVTVGTIQFDSNDSWGAAYIG